MSKTYVPKTVATPTYLSSTTATPTYLSIGDGIINDLNSTLIPFVNNFLTSVNVQLKPLNKQIKPMKSIPMIHRSPIVMDSYIKNTKIYFNNLYLKYSTEIVSELNQLLKTYLSSILANDDQRMYDEYSDEAVAQPTITPQASIKRQDFQAVPSPDDSMMTKAVEKYNVPQLPVPTLIGGSKRSTRKLDMKKRR